MINICVYVQTNVILLSPFVPRITIVFFLNTFFTFDIRCIALHFLDIRCPLHGRAACKGVPSVNIHPPPLSLKQTWEKA